MLSSIDEICKDSSECSYQLPEFDSRRCCQSCLLTDSARRSEAVRRPDEASRKFSVCCVSSTCFNDGLISGIYMRRCKLPDVGRIEVSPYSLVFAG